MYVVDYIKNFCIVKTSKKFCFCLHIKKNILTLDSLIFFFFPKHINDMSGAIHLEDTLKKAEGIYIQLKDSKKLPAPVAEIIGLDVVSPSDSGFVASRERSPHLDLNLKENGLHTPNSGSGTTGNTPDDSSIEILAENGEVGVNNFFNWFRFNKSAGLDRTESMQPSKDTTQLLESWEKILFFSVC